MKAFASVLLAFTAFGTLGFAADDAASRARQMEREGDALGARAFLKQAASDSPSNLLAYGEFLDRHRDPEARAVYEKAMGQLADPANRPQRERQGRQDDVGDATDTRGRQPFELRREH